MMKAPPGYQWVKITDLKKTRIHDGPDCYPWRACYAWLPVKTVMGKYVWRQRIFKRRVWVAYGDTAFHMEPEVEYATAFDLLVFKDE